MDHFIDLTGKKYIVTGASSGIGKEVCKKLDSLGATIILIARDETRLKECIRELEGEHHRYYCFDLSNVEEIENLVKIIVEENGKLDGFVHSAGVGPTRPLKSTKFEFVLEVFKINTFAFMELLRVYSLKKYNTGSGAVVGISSAQSVAPTKGVAAYSASKAGMDAIVKVAAKELSAKNIRINNLQPVWVKTKMMTEYLKNEDSNNSESNSVLTNALEPSEVANAASFLLSEAASGINGRSILMEPAKND